MSEGKCDTPLVFAAVVDSVQTACKQVYPLRVAKDVMHIVLKLHQG